MTRISTAVVTGGAGFIGSHIVDRLIQRGVETTVIDDFSTGTGDNLAQHTQNPLLHMVRGSASQIGKLLSPNDHFDVVFHEAAIASVPRSIADPLFVHNANVNASMEVMSFCVNRGVRRLVFASSAAVYGVVDGVASETLLCSPSSPYGSSKLAVECYLASFKAAYGLETVALRYFNVYGPRQRMNDYSGVITVFANGLLRGAAPVIYGDGLQTRDFVHVSDIAAANMLAMERDSAAGQVFNVASGVSTSILTLYQTLQRVTGVQEIVPQFAPPRNGDVRSGAASISKIERLMGYKPAVTLEQGLGTLVGRHAPENQTPELAA